MDKRSLLLQHVLEKSFWNIFYCRLTYWSLNHSHCNIFIIIIITNLFQEFLSEPFYWLCLLTVLNQLHVMKLQPNYLVVVFLLTLKKPESYSYGTKYLSNFFVLHFLFFSQILHLFYLLAITRQDNIMDHTIVFTRIFKIQIYINCVKTYQNCLVFVVTEKLCPKLQRIKKIFGPQIICPTKFWSK